jgi:RNA polymerase sporulation-specific sigma factor
MNEVNPEDLERHMGLVVHVAGKHRHYLRDSKLDFEDLLSWGTLGLHHALRRFDPERGTKFSTYAGTCIHGYILNGRKSLHREFWNMLDKGRPVKEVSLDSDREEAHFLPIDKVNESEDQIIRRLDEQRRLELLWDHIPLIQRERVEMVLYSGLEQFEVADLLGLHRTTINLAWCRTIQTGKEVFGIEDARGQHDRI